MAEKQSRDFTRSRTDGEPNPGGEYVLTGSRYVYRDENKVLVVHRRGDKITLTDEQAARLHAGKPGSPFQRESDLPDEQEMIEIAVANEATKPAEEDGFRASPEGRTNRRVAAPRVANQEATPEPERADAHDSVPEPVTSTASKAGRR